VVIPVAVFLLDDISKVVWYKCLYILLIYDLTVLAVAQIIVSSDDELKGSKEVNVSAKMQSGYFLPVKLTNFLP
jgi:hypothetical protein